MSWRLKGSVELPTTGTPRSRATSKTVPIATVGAPFSIAIRVEVAIPARSARSVCFHLRMRRSAVSCRPRSRRAPVVDGEYEWLTFAIWLPKWFYASLPVVRTDKKLI